MRENGVGEERVGEDNLRSCEALGVNQSRLRPPPPVGGSPLWFFLWPRPPQPYSLDFLPQIDFVNCHATLPPSPTTSNTTNNNPSGGQLIRLPLPLTLLHPHLMALKNRSTWPATWSSNTPSTGGTRGFCAFQIML